MELRLCVPCLFGLEGLAADELRRLGLKDVQAENGRVFFTGGEDAVARANLSLRTGERVLIELGSFPCESFEQLFEGCRALPWECFLAREAAFPVAGHCLDAKLFSVPDCQRIVKKAVAERLKSRYGLDWLPETGAVHQIRFFIMKDRASLCLDTSGVGLHKRGYRPAHNAAPLRETLAAALVLLSRYRGKGELLDPFCGSGTIPIEAALIALNRAPGLGRRFAAMDWPELDGGIWLRARSEALDGEFKGVYTIRGADIDPAAVEIARANARRAGTAELIRFETADATALSRSTERGVIVTNPPYGERLLERQDAEALYRGFGRALDGCAGWQLYLLSSHPDFERHFGRKADKKRKLYNGMIKCDLYMYYKG